MIYICKYISTHHVKLAVKVKSVFKVHVFDYDCYCKLWYSEYNARFELEAVVWRALAHHIKVIYWNY